MALLAQTVIHQLRSRLGEPASTWEARHLAHDFFLGLDGDVRVAHNTSIVTYYNAPNVEHLRTHYEHLPEKLRAEHVDPRIPWLYDFESTSASAHSPASMCTPSLRVKKTGRKRSLQEGAVSIIRRAQGHDRLLDCDITRIEEAGVNWETLYCPHRDCRDYGKPFAAGLWVKNGSSCGELQVRCNACGGSVALSYGTAYYRVSAACLDQLREIEPLFPSWDEFHHGC